MTLPAGHHQVPNGHLAAVITYLEMTVPFLTAPMTFPNGVSASREKLSVAEYRQLFLAIGAPWLWQSRLVMAAEILDAIISHDQVETWIIRTPEKAIGLVELDFRPAEDCELAFFGLVPDATGKGLGRPMMALAQTQAFERKIKRLHLHTCTLDAPQALGFYQKSGFIAYKRSVEIFADPRLNGVLPKDTGAHVPCLK